jgi:hypothetical protein
MSNLDRSMHISLWAHNSFIEGSHMTKNVASVTVYYQHVIILNESLWLDAPLLPQFA